MAIISLNLTRGLFTRQQATAILSGHPSGYPKTLSYSGIITIFQPEENKLIAKKA